MNSVLQSAACEYEHHTVSQISRRTLIWLLKLSLEFGHQNGFVNKMVNENIQIMSSLN